MFRPLDTELLLLHVHLSRLFCQLGRRPFLVFYFFFFFFFPPPSLTSSSPLDRSVSYLFSLFLQRSDADGVQELSYSRGPDPIRHQLLAS